MKILSQCFQIITNDNYFWAYIKILEVQLHCKNNNFLN